VNAYLQVDEYYFFIIGDLKLFIYLFIDKFIEQVEY
jgi:hypothetical protein